MNPIEKKKKKIIVKQAKKTMWNQESKKSFLNLVEKIDKLIVKKLKLNINDHIKTYKNHNLFQV
jgi:hypothetical protein